MNESPFSQQHESLINQLSHILSIESDENFFPSLAIHLAQFLNADYALIGELIPGEREQVRTLGFAIDGKSVDNISYFLEGTPCEKIVESKACVYESGVQKIFPEDMDLVDMAAEGYAGISLRKANGDPLGLVSVLFRQPVPHPKQVEQFLRLFAGRASSELERRLNQADLARKNKQLHLQGKRFEALYNLSQLDPEDAQGLKEFALEAAMQITQSTLGYIFLVNSDETVLSLHVWSKSVMGACKIFEPQTEFNVADTGLWGEAIRLRKPIITNDYEAPSSLKKGLPEGHVPITRHLNLPIFDQGKIVMVAGVSNKQEAYDEEDARHLTLLMDGLWRALAKNQFVAALHESEQSFRRFYENSPLSYQSLDVEGRFVDVNPAWVETFGYSREEILGSKFSDIMTADSEALVAERFPILKEKGKLNDAAFELIRKDGRHLLVTLHGRSSYDERGNFQHTNCILTDVTQARKAESRLRQSEEMNRMMSRQFQTLLDGIPDRILLLDKDLRIVWTNQKEDLQSKPFLKDPKGLFCYEAIQGKASSCPECPVVSCFDSGEVSHCERVNPDGRIWQQRAFPIRDDDGRVFNVVEIGQDVTENVRLHKDIARTGQLAAVGELAAGVAHEINNPINGVINYAQLLQNRSASESQEHTLAGRIIKEGDRIARIVKQLLFLSRDDGSEKQSVDLAGVLSESLSLVGSQLNNEGIDLEISLEEGLPKLIGYTQQLEQLFLNIISNARYALNCRFPQKDPNKRLTVTIYCEDTDSESCLVVRFRDLGIGIKSELLGKVMQPFITSKPSAEGTGLGLSISNDIVKSHGGRLHIDSEEGIYTEVTIRFPVQCPQK
jgi:PAS domain S-box-containing protein